ncbi:MAG: 3-oxoacyl-[acyl-carrier-protein] synthase III C-terminal domain-containing protein [Sulfuricaulis sp.]|nr:3-oxoacyl-[acyl-carrier-protein] synthase III C-terminal domain-containing protein [Sulfuricaulis sp.]
MQRAAIAAAHQWMAPGLRSQAKGQRAFCSWDEDSVTMAVEAARDVLGTRPRDQITTLALASTTLPFADLQPTALVAGALGLARTVSTLDLGYSQRAATSGLIAAFKQADGPALFIASERPGGKPASSQEIGGGAGAAAFTLGDEGVIATLLASVSSTAMFVDHFRAEGASFDYFWEERWIRDEGYLKLVTETVKTALQQAGVAAGDVSHFVLGSPFKGVATALIKKLGIPEAAEANALQETCGYTGVAHGLLMLAHVLEQAKPGETIVLAGFGQGVDALVLRATDEIGSFAPRRGVSGALADAQIHEAYLRLLSYQGGVELEWGMRAEKTVKTAFTEQYRSSGQLASFVAGKCGCCGTVQFPQMPYCVNPACNATRSNFTPHPLFDEGAQVLTHTADWLTYHPAPPLYVGFVQFDQGARLLMEMVDVGAAGLDVGTPLRMVFRVKDIDKTRGYSRYFWKATPLQA